MVIISSLNKKKLERKNIDMAEYYTDPEAYYYTSKAFPSQSVSFRYQNVLFRSVPKAFSSVQTVTNCFVQSVPTKSLGLIRKFSLSLSKWRNEKKVKS